MDYALEFQEVAILQSFLVTKHHGDYKILQLIHLINSNKSYFITVL